MKICSICETILSKRQRFYCSSACRQRDWVVRNRNANAMRSLRNNQNTAQRIYYRTKHRAKKNNIPFTITVADIIVPTHCSILGIELVSHQNKRGFQDNSPSLDRIIPDSGYIPGNVRVISARANLLKNNASLQELRLVMADLEGIYAHCNV